MNVKDALKVFGLEKTIQKEDLKKNYKNLSKKYHPDLGGSVHMMTALNLAFESLKNIDFETSTKNPEYGEKLNSAINVAKKMRGALIEVCGAWVWVSGDTKKHKETLKETGFKWANKKEMWYFRPEDFKAKNRGKSKSMASIRAKYGSSKIQAEETRKISTSF